MNAQRVGKRKTWEEELAKETQSRVREIREEPEKSNGTKTGISKGKNGPLSPQSCRKIMTLVSSAMSEVTWICTSVPQTKFRDLAFPHVKSGYI